VPSPDVIIAGAGIIGLSTALELQRRGAQVLVLDRGQPGQEASSAAAGMLAPSDPETPLALRPLAFRSAELYPEFVRMLESASGVIADFRRQGTIAFLDSSTVPPQYQPLTSQELSGKEPALDPHGRKVFFVQDNSVDPALLARAALAAASRNGIEVRANIAVSEIRRRGEAFEVHAGSEPLSARTVVGCRGAWSGVPVKPRKGQSLYVQPQEIGFLQHVVAAPEVYLVPRSSGKILIGATVEDVGYDKTVQPATVHSLYRAATQLVPELASAAITESWAGLRPGTPDNLPLLGETETPGIFIASGHFRNGILLAPVTARVMADLVMNILPEIDITAFSPLRFAPTEPSFAKTNATSRNS
jgi:glycine oxidase